jgi:hypothetical protein
LGLIWDIGQVPSSNFDWLPFTPSMVVLSDPSIGIRVGWVTLVGSNRLCDPKATWRKVLLLVVFNGEDFGYWKNQTHNYLLSQGRGI